MERTPPHKFHSGYGIVSGSETVLKRSRPLFLEVKMRPLQTDLSGFARFEFERSPIGIKFQFFRPDEIEPLAAEKELSLCEILREAQTSKNQFFLGKDHRETCVGKILLGMQDMEAFAESGQIGEKLQIFQEARVNYAFYKHVPKFNRNIVNYVVFAPLDSIPGW